MGISGALSALTTPLLQASAAQNEGELAARNTNDSRTLQAIQLLRQQHEDAINDELRSANIGHITAETAKLNAPPPKRLYDPSRGVMVDQDAGTASPVTGLPQKPEDETWGVSHDYTLDGKHVPVKLSNRGAIQDLSGQPVTPDRIKVYEAPKDPSYTVIQPQGGGGAQAVNTKNPNDVVPLPFDKAGGAGAAGGAPGKRQEDYVKLMEQSFPDMERLAGKVRPNVIALGLSHPNAGNLAMTPEERQYLSAARNFLAGDLHEESGARLSHDQLAFGQQRYLPLAGDDPATMTAKLETARKTMSDRRATVAAAAPAPPPPGGGGRGSAGPKTLSPEDAAHAQREPEFAAWARRQGYQVP